MRANHYVLISVLSATLFFFSPCQTATAEPPEKPGNPGVPGLLAKISELNDIVAAQQEIIDRQSARIEELEDVLDDLQNFAPVPKTGQTDSYADGDDGHLQKGVAWPAPRFTDNLDGTVTDNLTGLMWTQDVNIYGTTSWSDAIASCNSCNVGDYTDWYLPNIKELTSLLDYGADQYPMLPAGNPFTGNIGPSYGYWSSTSDSFGSPYLLSFENSDIFHIVPNLFHKVWCVRGMN